MTSSKPKTYVLSTETPFSRQDKARKRVKVSHHLRRMTGVAHSEEDIKAIEGRIRAIETSVRAVISQLKTLDPAQRVDISGLVTVQPVA